MTESNKPENTEINESRKSKKSRKVKKEHDVGREVTEWVVSIIIAVALALVIHNNVFQIIKVDGPSMQETLYTGERMFITPFSYMKNSPERGDIIVTNFPNDSRHFVKRVIGLEGEIVEVNDGRVYINGNPLFEEYLHEEILTDMKPTLVLDGSVFVMGDNRNNSSDSRRTNVGSVAENLIIGKVQAVVYPFSEYEWFEDIEYGLS